MIDGTYGSLTAVRHFKTYEVASSACARNPIRRDDGVAPTSCYERCRRMKLSQIRAEAFDRSPRLYKAPLRSLPAECRAIRARTTTGSAIRLARGLAARC